jgi:hypothetical protein
LNDAEDEATRLHHARRRRGGGVAAHGAHNNRSTYGAIMEIDLHGYDPRQIVKTDTLAKIVQQAWEMGEPYL